MTTTTAPEPTDVDERVHLDPADLGELVSAQPDELVVGRNVRTAVDDLDAAFLQSLRTHGVLQAIDAYRDPDGDLVVLRGQRRTLGAVQVGLELVPVRVVPRPDDPDVITTQVVENTHREPMTVADKAGAYDQLAAFGLTAAQIARRTSTRTPDVEIALRVARNPAALGTVAQRPAMTLQQADVIERYADDKSATTALVQAIDAGSGFDHTAERLNRQRAEHEQREAVATALREEGVTVVDDVPGYGTAARAARLYELKHGRANCTPKNHAACPGHAAAVTHTWDGGQQRFVAIYLCTDWKKHDHKGRNTATSTPKETAAAKAERARATAGNQAWRDATAVRRRWLADLFQSKKAPDDVEGFLAETLNLLASLTIEPHSRTLHELRASEVAPENDYSAEGKEAWAKIDETLRTELTTATKARKLVLAASCVLADLEDAAARHDWRTNTGWAYKGVVTHLRWLDIWGYDLSPIERAVLDGTEWHPSETAA